MPLLFEGEVAHDYHQVYLCDAGMPDLPDDYSDETLAPRVMAGPESLIVHIAREMPVPFRVELHEERPAALELAAYDHVVETGISAPSGALILAGLLEYPPEAPRLDIAAARFGVIVTFAALGSLSVDGLQGEDRYAIHLWPEPKATAELIVLKSFP